MAGNSVSITMTSCCSVYFFFPLLEPCLFDRPFITRNVITGIVIMFGIFTIGAHLPPSIGEQGDHKEESNQAVSYKGAIFAGKVYDQDV